MKRGLKIWLAVWMALGAGALWAQAGEAAKADTDRTFTFTLQQSARPMRFELVLDAKGYVSGVAVYGDGDQKPRQTLASCGGQDETLDEFEHSTELPLLSHQDLNFDGFNDVELLYYYQAHLGKAARCIYLWDAKVGRFEYSKMLTGMGVNLEAHPEDKTLTSHEDWMFGSWQESVYRWMAGRSVLVEQTSLLGSWGTGGKGCRFTFTCSRRIAGKMHDTLRKPVCTPDEMDDLPGCPDDAEAMRRYKAHEVNPAKKP